MSGINIRIKAGDTAEKSSVAVIGELVHIIVDSERASFGIRSDADIKRAVGNYFGKDPDNVWLHSPTLWGDMYKMYGWQEVQTVLEPTRAEILDITTTPTILATATLTNDSSKTATFSKKITEQVSNTVSTEWTNSSSVSFGQSISYGIQFLGTGGGGQTTFGFEHTWGKNETVSQETTVGTETEVTVELKPKEKAIIELSANSGKMLARVYYKAHLRGGSAVNYNYGYKDHHYWYFPIGDLLGDSNVVEITQDVEVGFYSNATAKVKDAGTMQEMKFHMAQCPSEPPSAQ